MVYQGRIENGVVVFREPVPLANGTAVRVEAAEAQAGEFWESCSLDELARRQGVPVPRSIQEVLGGWPEDELDDGFENVVASWRERELEQAK
ncbi:MAG TPA: hypothetical protein VG099_31215 [Gemmataceae bacterium]|nr:hypothetical protein [Gemmataceae bacterium]